MIRPSEVDTSNQFVGTMGEYHREEAARRIVILSQVTAFVADDDRWHPFSIEDFNAGWEVPAGKPLGKVDSGDVTSLERTGYLTTGEDQRLAVTPKFLSVIARFATPESFESVIASA